MGYSLFIYCKSWTFEKWGKMWKKIVILEARQYLLKQSNLVKNMTIVIVFSRFLKRYFLLKCSRLHSVDFTCTLPSEHEYNRAKRRRERNKMVVVDNYYHLSGLCVCLFTDTPPNFTHPFFAGPFWGLFGPIINKMVGVWWGGRGVSIVIMLQSWLWETLFIKLWSLPILPNIVSVHPRCK